MQKKSPSSEHTSFGAYLSGFSIEPSAFSLSASYLGLGVRGSYLGPVVGGRCDGGVMARSSSAEGHVFEHPDDSRPFLLLIFVGL